MTDLERALSELRAAIARELRNGGAHFFVGVWVGMLIMFIAFVATQGWPS
jgi:hypothetical protein